MRRVVVTGLGLVTPLGSGVEESWKRLVAGESGLGAIQKFDVSDLPAKVAGTVPRGETSQGRFNADDWVPPKDQRKMDEFIVYGIAAGEMAIADSGWVPQDDEQRERTGVMIGSGIGGLQAIYEGSITLKEKGPRRISPFFIPSALINLVSGHVSIKHGFKGPNHSAVTACSTGVHAIGDAARLIALDDADVMVAGSAEAAVSRLGIAGFAAARALSTSFNDTPTRASRPWDKDRDGFVMGEGAGIVVLEELEHAKRRGAPILAELLGFGSTDDAHHITAPMEDGDGPVRAILQALADGRVNADQVQYVNAHGTSTSLNDKIETLACKKAFGDHARTLAISSTKSMCGHLLGASGALELAVTALTVQHGKVHPTINYETPDPDCDLDYVPNVARDMKVDYAISNSLGFGGHNTCLLVGRYRG